MNEDVLEAAKRVVQVAEDWVLGNSAEEDLLSVVNALAEAIEEAE